VPLKFSLKPGEKFVLNGAVLSNGDKKANLVIQNQACLLREKDILQPDEANTPARRIYFPIMMMYLDGGEADTYYDQFAARMSDFMGAVKSRDVLTSCVEISKDVMTGAYYKALVKCRDLIEYERERLSYDPQSLSKNASCV
jgi:flagellar protein FlbT